MRVVADGDDEAVGLDLCRALPQIVIAAEHRVPATTSELVGIRPVEHADDRVVAPRVDGVDHLTALIGAADDDHPHDGLPWNGSIVA